MKSSLRISVAAIGLVSSVLISAAAAPAAKKIAPIDYIVDEGTEVVVNNEEVMNDSYFGETNAEINNEFVVLDVNDEELKPTVVEKKPVSSSAPSSSSKTPSNQSSSKNQTSSSAISSGQSSSNTATSSQTTSTAPPTIKPDAPDTPPANSDESGGEMLKFNTNGTVYTLPVKEALKRIVSNEINEQFNYEAIKAQVICAHSFVKYYNDMGQTASVGSQNYKVGGKIDRAVEEVYNEIMTFNGKTVCSQYFACSAGRTQSSKEVWGGARAYNVSVESKYDYLADYYNLSSGQYTQTKVKSNFLATTVLSESYVKGRIQSTLGVTPSGDPSTWFQFLDANNGGVSSGGYVAKIIVAGKSTNGNKVRTMLNLRSAAFEISYANGSFTVTTRGYGHGVGLSQWGAHFYADKEGWTYRQILSHYFTGIAFAKVV